MSGGDRVVRVLADVDEVSRTAAGEIARRAAAAVDDRGLFTIALAGGSTPRRLYSLLADPGGPFRDTIPWESTHFFWGDERHVPPDHADSNYRMVHEAMLSRVSVPLGNVHRIRAENPDSEAAARAYETALGGFFSSRGSRADDLPRFDLVLLGMGPDGHTASLFPGTDAVGETVRMVRSVWVPKFETHRITLTPPVINAAAAVIFLVTGEGKAETLRAVLEEERRVDVYPSQAIRPSRGELIWLVDRAAGSRLKD